MDESLFGILGRLVSSLSAKVIDVFLASLFNGWRLIRDTGINVPKPRLSLVLGFSVVKVLRHLTKRPIPLFTVIVPESGYPGARIVLKSSHAKVTAFPYRSPPVRLSARREGITTLGLVDLV